MAFKFALKCPSQSLWGPPDPQLWHGKPSRTLHIHHGAACHIIFYHLVQNKNFLVKRKNLKNTNLWLKPCLDVVNPDHKEYLCIFRHIFMAKSGDLKTFFNLFFCKNEPFLKTFFFFEAHREACIEVEIKWLPFCTKHLEIHFLHEYCACTWNKFHWNLFQYVHSTISQHRFRFIMSLPCQVTSHYLKQLWLCFLIYMCHTALNDELSLTLRSHCGRCYIFIKDDKNNGLN